MNFNYFSNLLGIFQILYIIRRYFYPFCYRIYEFFINLADEKRPTKCVSYQYWSKGRNNEIPV